MNEDSKNRVKVLEELMQRIESLKKKQEIHKQQKMQEEVYLMEGFYKNSIKQAEKSLSSVRIGEIVHVDDFGKRLFEILSKNNFLHLKVKDVKTGKIMQVYANQIIKIEEKSEMVEILYEKDRKV